MKILKQRDNDQLWDVGTLLVASTVYAPSTKTKYKVVRYFKCSNQCTSCYSDGIAMFLQVDGRGSGVAPYCIGDISGKGLLWKIYEDTKTG